MPLTTKSGAPTKLGHFESNVKGKMPDSEMYAIANKQGLMHGNKATVKGARKSSTASNPMRRGLK